MQEFLKKKALTMAALLLASALLAGCAKENTPQVSFFDLKLGAAKADITAQLGEEYEEMGTTPKRMNYADLSLFDFVGRGTSTKTMVFLNLDDCAYTYIYYIYGDISENEEKLRELFTEKFGEATANELDGVDWKSGDLTYTCIRGDDYVAISVY